MTGEKNNTEISLPFRREMEEAVINDRKSCTSRPRKVGDVGSYFCVRLKWFKIVAIEEQTLSYVAENLYKEEGFNDSQGFIDIWKDIHPTKGWVPDQKVFVHHFKAM